MNVTIKLSQILQDRNVSQRELSRLTEIRLASISEMCNNQTKQLPLDNLAKICEALGCEITDILELRPE